MTGARSREAGSRVNAFRIEDTYCFRHYFDGEAVFARLRRYYENEHYRFAVPAREFDGVRRFLSKHGYELREVADLERYTVAVAQYTAHPDDIFKQAVDQRSRDGYNLFVLKDADAVERAVAEGATRLRDADVALERTGQQRLSAV